MTRLIGRAEVARILRVTEYEVVRLSRAGHLGPVHRGPAGGFTWRHDHVTAYARKVKP